MKLERQIADDEAHLATVNILALEEWPDLGLEASTVGALVVGELDNGDRCISTPARLLMRAEPHVHGTNLIGCPRRATEGEHSESERAAERGGLGASTAERARKPTATSDNRQSAAERVRFIPTPG